MIRHSQSQNRISLNIKVIYGSFGSDEPKTIVTHGSVRPHHVIQIWQPVDDDAWNRDNIAKRLYFTRATMFGWSVGNSCHGEPFQMPGPINAMEDETFSIKLQPNKKVYPLQISGGDTWSAGTREVLFRKRRERLSVHHQAKKRCNRKRSTVDFSICVGYRVLYLAFYKL